MSLFALLNNLHFVVEMIGAIAFGMVGWLAVDAFSITRNFKTISRGIGFFLLAIASVVHAAQFEGDLIKYVEYALALIGLVFVIINLIAEAPVDRPEFKAILVLPPISAVLWTLNSAMLIGYIVVGYLAYKQFRKEFKYALIPFIVSFGFLSAGALLPVVFSGEGVVNIWWIAEHVLRIVGFFALGVWVWSYLELRIREELLLILVGTTLFMATVVSLSFSTLLIHRITENTSVALLSNARVLDLSLQRMLGESSARASLARRSPGIVDQISKTDFVGLEQVTVAATQNTDGGFLTIVDAEGDILVSSSALSRRDENIADEGAIARALKGEEATMIEWGALEGFSIRSASPVMKNDKVVGAVVFGFPLDDAFVDGMKDATGLDFSIFEGTKMAATTEFQSDERTRMTGFEQNDPQVLDAVMRDLGTIVVTEKHGSRTTIAAYVPLSDKSGQVVGMLSASKPEREIVETMNATNRYTIVIVLGIMLLLSFPLYYIARRLGEEIG